MIFISLVTLHFFDIFSQAGGGAGIVRLHGKNGTESEKNVTDGIRIGEVAMLGMVVSSSSG